MTRRMLVVAALLLVTFGYLARKSTAEPMLSREPLSVLPLQLGPWIGRLSPDLEPEDPERPWRGRLRAEDLRRPR